MDPAAQDDVGEAFAALVHRLASPLGAIANYAYLLPQEGDRASRDGILAAIASARATLRDAQRWLDAMATTQGVAPEAGVDLAAALRVLAEDAPEPVAVDAPDAVAVALPEAAALRLAEALMRSALLRGTARLAVEGGASGQVTVTLPDATWSDEEADRAFALFPPLDCGSNDATGELALAGSLVRRLGGRVRGAVGSEGQIVVHLHLPTLPRADDADQE